MCAAHLFRHWIDTAIIFIFTMVCSAVHSHAGYPVGWIIIQLHAAIFRIPKCLFFQYQLFLYLKLYFFIFLYLKIFYIWNSVQTTKGHPLNRFLANWQVASCDGDGLRTRTRCQGLSQACWGCSGDWCWELSLGSNTFQTCSLTTLLSPGHIIMFLNRATPQAGGQWGHVVLGSKL